VYKQDSPKMLLGLYYPLQAILRITGVARNFDWEGLKMEKFDFFGDAIKTDYFEVQFRHKQLEKPQFSQITQL